jgi:hypothetical protein
MDGMDGMGGMDGMRCDVWGYLEIFREMTWS